MKQEIRERDINNSSDVGLRSLETLGANVKTPIITAPATVEIAVAQVSITHIAFKISISELSVIWIPWVPHYTKFADFEYLKNLPSNILDVFMSF